MTIVEQDFTVEPCSVSPDKYNLTFNKRVKKRDTGQYAIEPGDTMYGLTLSSALRKIVHKRVAKKYEDDNITLKEFFKEYKNSYKELTELCKDE